MQRKEVLKKAAIKLMQTITTAAHMSTTYKSGTMLTKVCKIYMEPL